MAVNGDGVSLGFLDILDDYSSTKAGKLSRYYIGVSYLHMGEYDLAVDYLKKFKTKDMLLAPLAQSAIGDAYIELGDYNKAITAYNKALKINENNLTSPAIMYKLALAHEANGENQKALDILKQANKDFPNNSEAVNIERAIARLQQN
jgi:TolA-binding protein